MLEKSVDDLLLLSHKLLAHFETVGFALDIGDSAMRQDAVRNSGGDGDIGKHFVLL